MKKLFIFDMDGTFLKSDHTYNPAILTLIDNLKAKGHRFGLATGRPKFAIEPLFKNAFDHFDVIITNNGCEYYTENFDNRVNIGGLEDETVELVANIVRENDGNLISFDKVGFIADYETQQTGQLSKISQMRIGKDLLDYSRHHSKLMVYGESHFLDALSDIFSDYREHIDFMKSQDDLLEIVPLGVNKGNALNMYIEAQKYNDYEVYTFGDNFNDIDLLKAGDIAVAVDNAVEPLKEIADHIIESNDEDAIYNFLHKF